MEILTRWENFFHNSAVAYVGARVVLRMTRPYLRILGDDELLEYWSGIPKRLETQMQKQIWRSPTGTKQSKKKLSPGSWQFRKHAGTLAQKLKVRRNTKPGNTKLEATQKKEKEKLVCKR